MTSIADREAGSSVRAKLNAALAITDRMGGDSAAAEVMSFGDFGCVGDGQTDDSAAYQSAVTWAAGHVGRLLVGDLDAEYRINGTITATGSIAIDYRGAKTTFASNANGIRLSCTEGEVRALSTDYTKGSTTLAVSAFSSAPEPGAIGCIKSDATDKANRDRGSLSTLYRTGERFVVGSGSSSTTSIDLENALEFTEGINPTSGAGEEAEVDSYTTAQNAVVCFLPNERVSIRNGVFAYLDGQTWATTRLLILEGFAKGEIVGCDFQRSYDAMIRNIGTYGLVIDRCRFFRGENKVSSSGQLGYGISDGGDYTKVIAPIGHDCRHIYTTNKGACAAGSTDFFDVINAGRSIGGTIVGGSGTGGTNGLWDTHHDAEGTSFLSCNAGNAQSFGLTLRGRRLTASDVKVRNSLSGLSVFTEFVSATDDDRDAYTNEKSAEAFTSARILGADVQCDELPLELHHATVTVRDGEYRTQDHCLADVKGTVTLAGVHRLTSRAGGVSHSLTGCLNVEDVNTNAAEAFPANSLLTIAGDVEIDARNAAAATVKAFSVGANSAILVTGRLRIMLPSGATLGDTARVTCEGAGRIEISVEGAADDSLVTNSDDLTGLVIEGIDGSFWWRDPADTNALHRDAFLTFVDGDVGVSHTGTTSQTDEVYTPSGQYSVKAMNADGSGMVKMRLTGRKTGSAGTATLRLTTDSNDFMDQVVLPAITDLWQIEATLIFSATNVQRFTATCTSQDNGAGSFDVEVMRSDETQTYPAATTYAFSVGVTLGDASDTVEFETCEIWATRGGLL